MAPAPVELTEGPEGSPVELHRYLLETAEWHKADVLMVLGFGAAFLTFLVILTIVVCYRTGK